MPLSASNRNPSRKSPVAPSASFQRQESWSFFPVFILLDAFLSWAPLTVGQRFVLFPLGLAFQLFWALKSSAWAPAGQKPIFSGDVFKTPPWGLWLVLGGLGVFVRLYHLVSLQGWPCWDDADFAYYAIRLSEKWQGALFFGVEKTAPLYTWLEGLFFRLMQPSLFSLWLYPALYSILAIPLVYLAARPFFSKSFSFLCAALAAFSFWPLLYGRFNVIGILDLVWELLLLGALGLFLKSLQKNPRPYALLLGCLAGGGLYVSILLVAPAVLAATVVLAAGKSASKRGPGLFYYFLLPALVLSLPLSVGYVGNILGGHILTYSAFGSQPVFFWPRLGTFLSYFTVLFFGSVDQSYWNFGPFAGGFLNPLLAAFFFVGLGELIRVRRLPLIRGIAWAAFLILAPVAIFNTVECVRIVLIFPFLIVIATAGILRWISFLKPSRRALFLTLALTLSAGFDLYRLEGPFHDWSMTASMDPRLVIKSPERFKAFQLLDDFQKKEGPGFVFHDFVSDVYDQSLLVATYPFNAARNPKWDPGQARWAAVLADVHYQKPLAERFPRSRFWALSDPKDNDGTLLLLAVIPISSVGENRTFQEWAKVHQHIQQLYGQMPYVVQNPDFHPVLRQLLALYFKTEKDPLLKAWVLEKALDILLLENNLTDGLWFLEQPAAATRSYAFLDGKFAHFYHRLGLALLKNGDPERARECFKRASIFDPKYELKRWLALCKPI